jgi:pyrroloquinoline-quinone synthase
MAPLAAAELEEAIHAIGRERYHHLHPFNQRMHAGTLSRDALRCWVANRYYYQTRIPIKDGLILTKSDEREFRREWVKRIHDHDGQPELEPGNDGGLELWLRLAEAVGLERADVERFDEVVPGVRRACDAYVEFVDGHDLLESVASSLTELFAGLIMIQRIEAFERHYDWVKPDGLAYFQSRTTLAPRDAKFGLAYVCEHAKSEEAQQRSLAALRRKCEILWSLLDAVERASARPRLVAHALLRTEPDGASVVVLPERAVRVTGSGRAILEHCDGTRSGSEVALALAAESGKAGNEAKAIADDVHDFLEEMERSGVIVFEPEVAQ